MDFVKDVRSVAVVGFGLMGRDISRLLAERGFYVTAVDVSEEVLKKSMEVLVKGPYGIEKAVERGKLTKEQADQILARIRTTTSLEEAAKEADLVIEAVVEDLGIKQEVFRKLDKACRPGVVLATNTSGLSITAIASATQRPQLVLGWHFFNPAHIQPLVEIVKGLETSDEVVEFSRSFLMEKLRKVPIVVKEGPGFASTRLGLLLGLEAIRVVEEGIATPLDVDLAMMLGYRHALGPFETGDLVGLDLRLKAIEQIYEQTKDPKWAPPRLLKQLVAAGYMGDPRIKPGSKGGFYEYFGQKKASEFLKELREKGYKV